MFIIFYLVFSYLIICNENCIEPSLASLALKNMDIQSLRSLKLDEQRINEIFSGLGSKNIIYFTCPNRHSQLKDNQKQRLIKKLNTFRSKHSNTFFTNDMDGYTYEYFNHDYKNILEHIKYAKMHDPFLKNLEIIVEKNDKRIEHGFTTQPNTICINFLSDYKFFTKELDLPKESYKLSRYSPTLIIHDSSEPKSIDIFSLFYNDKLSTTLVDSTFIDLSADGSYLYFYHKNALHCRSIVDFKQRICGKDPYFFVTPKEINFQRLNPQFSGTQICRDNPHVIVTKVTSDKLQDFEKKVEYICFDFEQKKWWGLSVGEIKKFNKGKLPQTMNGWINPEIKHLKFGILTVQERVGLHNIIRDNFLSMRKIQQEIDHSEKAFILHEPLSNRFPQKFYTTNN